MPTFFFFFFFLLLLMICYSTLPVSSYTPSPLLNRRTLHQPFFPHISQPPTQAPSPSAFPRYPSSTTALPFFPFFPSPPPPPSPTPTTTTSSLTNIPANISSLTFPISGPSPRHSPSKRLVPAIAIPILSLALLALALAFFLLRRRERQSRKPSRADGDRLFPANAAASDGGCRKLSTSSGPASSEFLYLGTVVSSRGGASEGPAAPPAAAGPSFRRLDSPELHPLPPLSRQLRRGDGKEPCCSSDEDFYSPRDSSAGKENPGEATAGAGSASRRGCPAAAMEKCGSGSSTLSAPSNPSSDSASSPTPSPSSPSPASSPVESTGGGAAADATLRCHAPPPPPPPMTPSLPNRKPPSPSPPSSPMQIDSNLSIAPPQPPSRPPPPPPAGCQEAKASKLLPCEPPVLVSPRATGLRSMAAVYPAESPKYSSAGLKDNGGRTPGLKLKPLHWDKVRATSEREMVWDRLKSSSFQLNEEMIETLFVCNGINANPKEMARRRALLLDQENRVLDPKKSQNIAILLRALNLTKEEVCEALLEGNADSLGTELLQTLQKMAPSEEEELKLKEYKDDCPFMLDPAEKFLKAVLDIPFAFKRVDAMLYIANFESEIKYLRNSFETLEAACRELRSSRIFVKLLEAVLKTGNRMNVGTNRGDAHAFKLDTLLKLVDIKGTDGKTTLLHFVVQEIIKAEGFRLVAANKTLSSGKNHTFTVRDDLEYKKLGLVVISGLGGELSNVKKAAAVESEVFTGYVSKLSEGIGKVNEVLRLNGSLTTQESGRRFHEAMRGFLKEAGEEIEKIGAQEYVALSLVKGTTEYFHGNSANQEVQPLRIFMIVRDFLSILDRVCKEVGKINERTMVGLAQQFPAPGDPTLPPLFPKFHSNMSESSDEDDSSSSSQ